MRNAEKQTIITTKIVEGLRICYNENVEDVGVPMSTYETPLFASCQRGAKVSQISPIFVKVIDDCMTRSVIFQGQQLRELLQFSSLMQNMNFVQSIIEKKSKHCKIKDIQFKFIGKLLYCRFAFHTGEASGHNMTTIIANEIANTFVQIASQNGLNIKYLSNSGNICIDKKVSAINSILGRGKNVVAEIMVSKDVCKKILRTTPDEIVELNIKKNFVGSIVSGSICSANAHYANMLAALFLPFGQDIANIVEGSQGLTYCEVENDNLYFSINLPNIICGCIGNGKNIDFVTKNLQMIGCLDEDLQPINNASCRLAGIIGAVVLCGELSLMATLTNSNELVKSHILLERNKMF